MRRMIGSTMSSNGGVCASVGQVFLVECYDLTLDFRECWLMLVDVDVINPHSFQAIHYPYLALIFRGITVLLTYSLQKTHMEPEMELFVLKWKRLKRRNPWGLQSRQTHDTSTMIFCGSKAKLINNGKHPRMLCSAVQALAYFLNVECTYTARTCWLQQWQCYTHIMLRTRLMQLMIIYAWWTCSLQDVGYTRNPTATFKVTNV